MGLPCAIFLALLIVATGAQAASIVAVLNMPLNYTGPAIAPMYSSSSSSFSAWFVSSSRTVEATCADIALPSSSSGQRIQEICLRADLRDIGFRTVNNGPVSPLPSSPAQVAVFTCDTLAADSLVPLVIPAQFATSVTQSSAESFCVTAHNESAVTIVRVKADASGSAELSAGGLASDPVAFNVWFGGVCTAYPFMPTSASAASALAYPLVLTLNALYSSRAYFEVSFDTYQAAIRPGSQSYEQLSLDKTTRMIYFFVDVSSNFGGLAYTLNANDSNVALLVATSCPSPSSNSSNATQYQATRTLTPIVLAAPKAAGSSTRYYLGVRCSTKACPAVFTITFELTTAGPSSGSAATSLSLMNGESPGRGLVALLVVVASVLGIGIAAATVLIARRR